MVDIVVVGSLNADLFLRVHRLPRPGETVHCYDSLSTLGGKGGNQAAAAARLGGRVSMVGRVGNDPFGSRSIEDLARQGIDTRHVIVDEETPTGTATVILPDRGANRIFVSPGANGRVDKGDVDNAEELLEHARILVLQFEIPFETVRHATELASRHGVKTILNPAPGYARPAEFLAQVDYLVPNATEAAILTGIGVKGLPAARKAAEKLLSDGVPAVIVTLGGKGALVAAGQELTHEPARKVQVVDTTAAGDAFVGALAVALVEGFSLREAVRYANCAGALATTKLGSRISLPSKEEVEGLFQSRGAI